MTKSSSDPTRLLHTNVIEWAQRADAINCFCKRSNSHSFLWFRATRQRFKPISTPSATPKPTLFARVADKLNEKQLLIVPATTRTMFGIGEKTVFTIRSQNWIGYFALVPWAQTRQKLFATVRSSNSPIFVERSIKKFYAMFADLYLLSGNFLLPHWIVIIFSCTIRIDFTTWTYLT